MAKKTKQLTAKREAYAAASDAVIRTWTDSKNLKEWLKQLRSVSKALEAARSDYVDELREYGSDGTKNKTRDHMKSDSDEGGDAPWVDSVDKKIEILENQVSVSWLTDIVDELQQTLSDASESASNFLSAVKDARKLSDPTDIEDDDPDYF